MSILQKSKNKTSNRVQIAIEGVKSGVLILPKNEYRVILEVSPINFELKSEEEQDAIIDTYESFLNSIGSSLQILIRTREIDIDSYIESVQAKLGTEKLNIYRSQIKDYIGFIRSLITSNKVLSRRFYIIVPYRPGTKMEFNQIKEQLQLKLDIISKGLMRLGMQTRELSDLEILDLFYSFYNPFKSKIQPLSSQILSQISSSLATTGGDK